MKTVLLVTITSILFSCATSKKIGGKKLADITENDFKPVKQVRYQRSRDKVTKSDSKFTSLTNSESIHRVLVNDGDIDFDDELSKIAKLCYKKEFSDAHRLIKINSRKYTKNPVFWNQVGTCYLLEGERRKALLFLNKALSLEKNYVPALNNLGVMYMSEKDYSRAVVAFKKAKKENPQSVTPRLNLANLLIGFGLYDVAIFELKNLSSSSKSDVDVNGLLAVAYQMKGDYKTSETFYNRLPSNYLEKSKFGINYALLANQLGDQNKARGLLSDISVSENSAWSTYYQQAKNKIGSK